MAVTISKVEYFKRAIKDKKYLNDSIMDIAYRIVNSENFDDLPKNKCQ